MDLEGSARKASGALTQRRKVSITALKRFAEERLPRESPLREVLITERDELSPEEFIAKLDVWLRLLRFPLKSL